MNQVISSSDLDDDLRPEYDLRELLKGGVRGKYAGRLDEGTTVVMLDPDVARAFPSSDAVNQALRLAIQLSRLAQFQPETSGR